MEYVCFAFQPAKPVLIPSQFLAGAGKTKLTCVYLITALDASKLIFCPTSSLVVDTLRNAKTSGSREALAFFYCDRNDPENSTPETVLRAIVKQLSSLEQDSDLLKPIVDKYERAKKAGDDSEPLDLDECRELIIQMLSSYPQTNIIIDALDECHHGTRSQLISALTAIMESAPDTNLVKIFISSRDDDDIVMKLSKLPNIRIDSSDNCEDIGKFIRSEVQNRIDNRELLRGNVSSDLRAHVIDTLIQRADGM